LMIMIGAMKVMMILKLTVLRGWHFSWSNYSPL
jgi:hypothetical protein